MSKQMFVETCGEQGDYYIPATESEIDEAADVAKERERLVERLNNLHLSYDQVVRQRDALLETMKALIDNPANYFVYKSAKAAIADCEREGADAEKS